MKVPINLFIFSIFNEKKNSKSKKMFSCNWGKPAEGRRYRSQEGQNWEKTDADDPPQLTQSEVTFPPVPALAL